MLEVHISNKHTHIVTNTLKITASLYFTASFVSEKQEQWYLRVISLKLLICASPKENASLSRGVCVYEYSWYVDVCIHSMYQHTHKTSETRKNYVTLNMHIHTKKMKNRKSGRKTQTTKIKRLSWQQTPTQTPGHNSCKRK